MARVAMSVAPVQCGHVPYLSVPELMGLGWFLPFVALSLRMSISTSPRHMASPRCFLRRLHPQRV